MWSIARAGVGVVERAAGMESQRPVIRMCARIANSVMGRGGVFTIEHPQSSYAWQEPEWIKLASKPCVFRHVLHQCRYGLRNKRTGEMVRKATTILSNAPLSSLKLRCNHRGSHSALEGTYDCGAAAAYPV
eukprot:gene5860-6237_t